MEWYTMVAEYVCSTCSWWGNRDELNYLGIKQNTVLNGFTGHPKLGLGRCPVCYSPFKGTYHTAAIELNPSVKERVKQRR